MLDQYEISRTSINNFITLYLKSLGLRLYDAYNTIMVRKQ